MPLVTVKGRPSSVTPVETTSPVIGLTAVVSAAGRPSTLDASAAITTRDLVSMMVKWRNVEGAEE